MDNQYYELHVTVAPERIPQFIETCSTINAKPIYIKLDKGESVYQLMLAATAMLPDDAAALLWAQTLGETLAAQFKVTRVKLESRLTKGPNEYYEAHWKLEEVNESAMGQFLQTHPGFLRSMNLFNPKVEYLSARIYGGDDPVEASQSFNLRSVALDSSGLPLKKTHYERCVWDSNPSIDNGWASN
jgi:hypothetical protein